MLLTKQKQEQERNHVLRLFLYEKGMNNNLGYKAQAIKYPLKCKHSIPSFYKILLFIVFNGIDCL